MPATFFFMYKMIKNFKHNCVEKWITYVEKCKNSVKKCLKIAV